MKKRQAVGTIDDFNVLNEFSINFLDSTMIQCASTNVRRSNGSTM